MVDFRTCVHSNGGLIERKTNKQNFHEKWLKSDMYLDRASATGYVAKVNS